MQTYSRRDILSTLGGLTLVTVLSVTALHVGGAGRDALAAVVGIGIISLMLGMLLFSGAAGMMPSRRLRAGERVPRVGRH